MKLWRILASHKDDSFTLTDWQDYNEVMDGASLIRSVAYEGLLNKQFILASAGPAWQEQYNGDHGMYLERLAAMPVEPKEVLPSLCADPDDGSRFLCPECGPSLEQEFTYAESVVAYRGITRTSRGTIQAHTDVESEDVGDGEPRLFHVPCLTYFDPASVTA